MAQKTDPDQIIYGTVKSNILIGGGGNDRIYGYTGNDIIDGGAGNDYIDAGAGNDIVHGGTGNDTVFGGDGNDIIDGDDGNDYLDGGAGTDLVFGDEGNDTLAFRMAEHGPASTSFLHSNTVLDGGCDTDTFRLILTRDEWLRGDVQADVARYVAFLDAEPGKLYNLPNRLFGNSDFNGSFAFNVFDLIVSRVEKFEVVVDGLVLDPRNQAVIARADAITTDEDHASAAFNLLANDSIPDLVRSVSIGTAAHGAVVLTQNYTDPAKPVASVVYTPNATYYQYLAAGESATDSFSYTVTDTNGDVSTAIATVTITGVNDGPLIVSGSYTGAVVEDAGATLSSTGAIVFSDLDLTDSHTVAVGAAKVTVANDTATGIAPTGGFGTLKAVVVENTADQNNQGTINWAFTADNATVQRLAIGQTATQVYTLTLTDKNGAAVTQTVTITLTGTEDAPTITAATATGAVTEDATTSVAGNIAFADADIVDTHSVAFAPQANGYLGTFATTVDKAATGTGAGTVKWTFAVDNAQIQNLAQGETLTQKYTVTVADNHGGTVQQVVTMTITGTNDAPVATADIGAPATEDGAIVTGSVATNDSDVDHGAALTYRLNAPVAGLTLAANGTYSFDPANAAYQALAAGEVQTIVAGYTVTDQYGATATTTLTIKITGTNDAPVAVADTNAVSEDHVVTGSVATNDSDVDHGATRTFALNAPVAGLTLNGDGSYRFDAGNAAYQALASGEVQVVVANYTVTDDKGVTATTTLMITVTGTNDAPVAVADTSAVNEDSVVTGSVATNDSDVDHGATRTFALNAPVAGLTFNSDGSYRFDASNAAYQSLAKSEVQVVVANYTVTDDKGATATSTLTITVTGTNDAPVAVADVAAGNEDSVVVGNVGVNDSDVDHGATRTFALNAPVAGLTLNSDGSYRFDAANAAYQALAAGEVQTIVAGYTVTDDKGATATTTLTITVTGTNDAPVAVADTNAVSEDHVVTGSVATNDSDVDHGATRTFALNAPVAGLTLDSDGSYRFDAGNAAYQSLSLGEVLTVVANYTVTDDKGATATTTLTITVTGTNDAPVAVADVAAPATEDGAVVTGSVATNDSDVDHGAHLTYALASPVAGLTLNTDGSYRFDAGDTAYQSLAAGQTRAISAAYIVTDEYGASASSILSITVTGTNDAPTIVAGSYAGAVTEDAAATLNATGAITFADVDLTDTHTVSVVSRAGAGDQHFGTLTASIVEDATDQSPTGTVNWVFTADNAAVQTLAQGEVSTQVYTLTVGDGHGGTVSQDVTITVIGTNDGPVITSAPTTGAVTEDATVTTSGDIAFADIDRLDTHAVIVTPLGTDYRGSFAASVAQDSTLGAAGHVGWSFAVDNAAVQDLAQGETLAQFYQVTVIDDHGLSVSQQVTVLIHGTNDAPIAVADTASVLEDRIVSGTVAGNDFDVDHDSVLTYALDAPVVGLTLNSDGSYSFDASGDTYQNLRGGQTSIIAHYTVTDQFGAATQSTLTVAVTPVNDAPTITGPIGALAPPTPAQVTATTTIHVAVIDSSAGQVAQIIAQLSDSSIYTFDIVELQAGNITSAADLAGFGVVIEATPYYANAGEAYYLALADYAARGMGGVVTFGLEGYKMQYVLGYGSTSANALDSVTPLAQGYGSGVSGNSYSYINGETLVYDTGHPVTAGVPTAALNNDTFYAGNNIDAGAVVLNAFSGSNAYYYGTGFGASVATAASGVHLVNLGGTYGVAGFSDSTTDTTGAFDRLLEQGVAYASGATAVAGLSTAEDTSLTITGLAFADIDAGGDAVTATLRVLHGNLTLATTSGLTITGNGDDLVLTGSIAAINAAVASIGYAPDANYNGQDILSVDIDDNGNSGIGGALTAHAAYGITVTSVNDAPVAIADSASVIEGGAIVFGSVAANDGDVDTGAILHYQLNSGLDGLTLNTDGSYRFDPTASGYTLLAAGEVGIFTANYSVIDQFGARSSADLVFTVTGVNSAPVAIDDAAQIDEDHAIDINAKANDYDPDHGDTTTITAVAATSSHGATLSLNADGTIHYDPTSASDLQALRLGDRLTDTFTYTITDAAGLSSTATVTVTIDGRTEAPVAHDDRVSTGENTAVSGSVIPNDAYTGSFTAVPNILVNGSFEDPYFIGPDSYGFGQIAGWQSADPSGFEVWGDGFLGNHASDGVQFVELDLAGYQDTYSQSLTTEVGRRYDLSFDLANRNGTDPYSNRVEFLVNGVSLGIITPASNEFTTYTFTFYGSGTDVIAFREPADSNDGVGGLIDNLRVASPNDVAISAVNGDMAAVGHDVAGSAGGIFVVNADGSYTFNPGTAFDGLAVGETATSSVTYTLTDTGGSSTATITVTINGENDAPIVTGVVTGAAVEDGAVVTLDALARTSDVDAGTTLSVVNVPASLPAGVTYNAATHSFALNPGNAAYQSLGAGQAATVAVSYGVSDGIATTAASASWTITGTNDAPTVALVILDQTLHVQDTYTQILPARMFADVDNGDVLTYSATRAGGAALPSWLTFDAATRTFSGSPTSVDTGTTNVTVTVNDGHGGIASDTFMVTVQPNIYLGTAANDTYTGTFRDDTIIGNGGSDTLNGGGGDDIIYGDAQGEQGPSPTVASTLTAVAQSYYTANHNLIGGLGGTVGFGEHSLAKNDDNSVSSLDGVPGGTGPGLNIASVFGTAGINFFGTNYTNLYINNNGNISFGAAISSFTPTAILGTGNLAPLIAPFWTDVDTRGSTTGGTASGGSKGTDLLYYDLDTVNHVLTVTWDDVGAYPSGSSPNAFQLQLIDRGAGDFDVIFRYEDVRFAVGTASPNIARAGYSSNTGASFELAGSGTNAVLDYENIVGNTGIAGVQVFQVRGGQVSTSSNDIIDGGAGHDTLIGGAGLDTFVFHAGEANGDTILDFNGSGAAAGDSLRFLGYGAGATFTQIGTTNQWVIGSADHSIQDVLTFANNAPIHVSDFIFA